MNITNTVTVNYDYIVGPKGPIPEKHLTTFHTVHVQKPLVICKWVCSKSCFNTNSRYYCIKLYNRSTSPLFVKIFDYIPHNAVYIPDSFKYNNYPMAPLTARSWVNLGILLPLSYTTIYYGIKRCHSNLRFSRHSRPIKASYHFVTPEEALKYTCCMTSTRCPI